MDLTRNANFFARDHMTVPPTSMTYASVVSRESGRIAFLLAALNYMDMLTCDIDNAYLNAYTTEKSTTVLFQNGVPHWKTVYVIVQALYALKISANSWRQDLCHTLNKNMGFESSLADNDVWFPKSLALTVHCITHIY